MEEDSIRSIEKGRTIQQKNKKTAKKVGISASQSSGRGPRRPRRSVRKTNTASFFGFGIGVLVILSALLFLITNVFSSFTLSLEIDTRQISLTEKPFTASKHPLQTGDLVYRVYTTEEITRSLPVPADGQTTIDTKSRGKLTIVNPRPELLNLVTRTRFIRETDESLVYRLQGASTVPAAKVVGGEIVPGELSVTVQADENGVKYNIENEGERFSIPGLQNNSKWKGVYAVAQSTLIGGVDGERNYINKDKRVEHDKQLETELEIALFDEIRKEANQADDIVFFENAVFIDIQDKEDIQGDNTVVLQKTGVGRAFFFRKSDVAQLLDTNATPLYDVSPDVLSSSPDTLTFLF